MLKINRILHPTDFSEPARAAFSFACSLARDHGARVTVLHVSPTEWASVSLATQQKGPVVRGELIQQLKESHHEPTVRIACHLAEGNPSEEILRWASNEHSDLIVMGTQGRSGLSRMIMGSVAEDVCRHAPCPVLTLNQIAPTSEGETKDQES